MLQKNDFNQISYNNDRIDRRLCISMSGTLVYFVIGNLLLALNLREGGVLPLVFKGAVAAGYMIHLNDFVKRIHTKMMVFMLAFVSLAVTQFILFPANREPFKGILIDFTLISLPFVLYIQGIRNYEVAKRVFLKTARVVAFLALSFVLIARSITVNGYYFMGYANACIFPTCLLLSNYLVSRSKKDLFWAGVLIFSIVRYGSRGALLCIASFIFISMAISVVSKKSSKKTATHFIVGVSGLLLILILGTVSFSLSDLPKQFGIESRTMSLFSKGGIYLSGREKIYNQVIEGIKDEPFLIRGIGADQADFGIYAHNFALEIFYENGALLGSLIVLTLLLLSGYTVYKCYKKRGNAMAQLSLILLCTSMPLLLVSGVIWRDIFFWSWIAMVSRGFVVNENAALLKRHSN